MLETIILTSVITAVICILPFLFLLGKEETEPRAEKPQGDSVLKAHQPRGQLLENQIEHDVPIDRR